MFVWIEYFFVLLGFVLAYKDFVLLSLVTFAYLLASNVNGHFCALNMMDIVSLSAFPSCLLPL